MQWFRVHSNLLNNPKFQNLSESLRARLLNLWCLANEGDGLLPDIAAIAWRFRIDEKEMAGTVRQLKTAGFLDESEDGLVPHDWNEHQFKDGNATERQKRYRDRKKQKRDARDSDGVTHVTRDAENGVTPSEQIQSRTETEQILPNAHAKPQLVPPLAGPSSEPPLPPALFAAFERCRDLHPNCTDPDAALREFLRLFWKGEITEADANAIHGGMRKWLDSEVWSEGQGRFSAEWRKFSAWIAGRCWLANPKPSAASKQAKRSSDGVDPRAEFVPPWKTAGGAA